MSVVVVIKKKRKRLYVYRNRRLIYATDCNHAGNNTKEGKRKIVDWVWGAVADKHVNFSPNTWFSFGDTFGEKKLRYSAKWPPVGVPGKVRCYRGTFKAKRINRKEAVIYWSGTPNPFPIWKDSNPYGVLAAKLNSRIWLHGTSRDRTGKDYMGEGIAGCVKVTNRAIRHIMTIAPKGSIVSIES